MGTPLNRSGYSGFFRDKVAIITGSSRGIGRATALELLKAGARVVVNGRRPESVQKTCDELQSQGFSVTGLPGDVSDDLFCSQLIRDTMTQFGKIDILINNAGGGFRGSIEQTPPEVMRSVIDANLMSAIYCTKAALTEIKKNHGSILFISSLSGIRGMPRNAPYCIAKMGMAAFSQTLSMELHGTGIHVGIIHVGLTDFDKDKKVVSYDGSLTPITRHHHQTREQVARVILKTIMKRKKRVVLTRLGIAFDLFSRISPALTDAVIRRSEQKSGFND